MKWKIFQTKSGAMIYSHNKAVAMGLGKPGDVCQYWYNIKQAKDGTWAVQCPEGTAQPEFEAEEETGL